MLSFASIAGHWKDILENIGAISGLFFAGYAFLENTRERKKQNLITLTVQHREIWSEIFKQPKLARVLASDLDLKTNPPTLEEGLFVKFLILNLALAYRTEGFFTSSAGLAEDIRGFFSLPVPASVWERMKPSQDTDFVKFVEHSRTTATGKF